MVSGSLDCSCIIWELLNFKPIERLIFLQSVYSLGVNLYSDYIVFCNGEYIWVWILSLDNLEHQLKFNLQVRIWIHNGIIYDICGEV